VIWPSERKVLALCGGVGGAKLALGLTRILSPDQLTIVVNTGDDFEHFGLTVCPDLDTVTYTLSGLSNPETGWGRQDESWRCLETLEQLGAETWFRLGDRDLALHLARRALLDQGDNLSGATTRICRNLGIEHPVIPMSDSAIRTIVETDEGELSFQHYFVREQCRPSVRGFRFEGADAASPSAGFNAALEAPGLDAILICPSNPFVSVAPMLALPGIQSRLGRHRAPVIAVSPIVANQAIKGPTAKMMNELGLDLSALGVFHHYGDLLDGFVIDDQDRHLISEFPDPDQLHCCNTVMESLQDRIGLAEQCLQFAQRLGQPNSDT
jgi:LPPG:FO 2-phospho-L-lactate transferase